MSVIGYTFGRVPDGLLFSNADDRAKVLYAVLTRWADLRPGQHPTRNDLAAALGCSVDSMDRAKNELVERGYLDVRERYVEGTKIRDANDWHLLPGPATESDPITWGSRKGAATMTRGNSEPASNGSRKGAAGGSRKGAATLSRREEQDLEKEKDPPTPQAPTLTLVAQARPSDEAMVLFQTWHTNANRERTVFSAKRRRLAVQAIKTYGLDYCLQAAVGWQHSPFHRGENDRGTVYNDFELIFRDSQQIERFYGYADGSSIARPTKHGMTDWRAVGDRWAAQQDAEKPPAIGGLE